MYLCYRDPNYNELNDVPPFSGGFNDQWSPPALFSKLSSFF